MLDKWREFLSNSEAFASVQETYLRDEMNLTDEQVKRALEPLYSYIEELREEIADAERGE